MEMKTPPKIHAYAYRICRAWYNGLYTMATKPIRFLELHYTMTQFLINRFIISKYVCINIFERQLRLFVNDIQGYV